MSVMDPRPIEQWEQIFAKLPAPSGLDSDQICAERILGDLIGYRPSGPIKRRVAFKTRDSIELKNAMIAFARMYIDHGVRP